MTDLANQIAALSSAATPGEWVNVDQSPESGIKLRGGSHHYAIAQLASYWQGPGPRSDEALANAALIVALRNAVPQIVAALNAADEADALRARVAELRELLRRYRTETPLGHQPHMIAHLVDELLEAKP